MTATWLKHDVDLLRSFTRVVQSHEKPRIAGQPHQPPSPLAETAHASAVWRVLSHPVLLLVVRLAVLAGEVVLDGDVQVPRVLRVGYAREEPCYKPAQPSQLCVKLKVTTSGWHQHCSRAAQS